MIKRIEASFMRILSSDIAMFLHKEFTQAQLAL